MVPNNTLFLFYFVLPFVILIWASQEDVVPGAPWATAIALAVWIGITICLFLLHRNYLWTRLPLSGAAILLPPAAWALAGAPNYNLSCRISGLVAVIFHVMGTVILVLYDNRRGPLPGNDSRAEAELAHHRSGNLTTVQPRNIDAIV